MLCFSQREMLLTGLPTTPCFTMVLVRQSKSRICEYLYNHVRLRSSLQTTIIQPSIHQSMDDFYRTCYSCIFIISISFAALVDAILALVLFLCARKLYFKNKNVVYISMVITFLVVLGIVYKLLVWLKKRLNSRNADEEMANIEMDNEFENGTGPKGYSHGELVSATGNFNEDRVLGQGGFGKVYKGVLSDRRLVAVKRISKGSKQGTKEYKAEVKIVSQLRHKNLVQLIGWCHQRKELLLVYEFMQMRSLDKHLFGVGNFLSWEVRYKIALGLASALLYLHEEWKQCVVHRDIKSSNVMLDSDFNAKLGDFGLARLVDHGKGPQTTVFVAGTRGYLAPECYTTSRFSKESDIYSFGIVALEVATGRKPTDVSTGVSLVEWVRDLYEKGNILHAADEKLKMVFNKLEMERLLVVGLSCARNDSKLRPSAAQVFTLLRSESPGTLPLELSKPSYPAMQSTAEFPSSAGQTI